MRITFERTGGFVGRKLSLTLELSELPPNQAENLRLLFDEANFLTLDGAPPAVSPARDEFHYMITVETKNVQHSVHATDTNMPESLRPIVAELSQLAHM